MIDETGPTGETMISELPLDDQILMWNAMHGAAVDPGFAPPTEPTLNLRRLALESAERHAIDADGRRLSGHGVLKLARMYLKFLEGE